jgi:hypothetical protein
MCRNITMLRGLEPPATQDEITAAALQYVRKVGGLSSVSATTREAVDEAVAQIAAVTAALLAQLPERRNPPPVEPPMRRRAAAAAARQDEADGEPGTDGDAEAHEHAHALGVPHTH